MKKHKLAIVFCFDISGHRHLYSSFMIKYFLSINFDVIFCYAGRYYKLINNKRVYEDYDSNYLSVFENNEKVQFINVKERLNAGEDILKLIQSIQEESRPEISLFIDGDYMKWLFLKQILPWHIKLIAKNYCIVVLSEFIYQRPLNLSILERLNSYLKLHRIYNDITLFTERFPLINKLIYKLLIKRKLISGIFSIDENFVDFFKNELTYYLPEPRDPNIEPVLDEAMTKYYRETENKLEEFLANHKDKHIILMFGDLENRKGDDMLVKLVRDNKDCVYIRAGRIKNDYHPTSDTKYIINELNNEGRYFEINNFISSQSFIKSLFSKINYLILPYHNYYRSSGVMTEAICRGVPVIVPNTGLMADRVSKHGLGATFVDRNYTDLYNVFQDFKNDFKKYKNNVRSYAAIFTINSTYKHLSTMVN